MASSGLKPFGIHKWILDTHLYLYGGSLARSSGILVEIGRWPLEHPLLNKFKDKPWGIPYSHTPNAVQPRVSSHRVISGQLRVDLVSYWHRC